MGRIHNDEEGTGGAAVNHAQQKSSGRLTLPIQSGMDERVGQLIGMLGADWVRNSDGTSLPDTAAQWGARIMSTYFPARGDNEFALAHPDETTRMFLSSATVTAMESSPLDIEVAAEYYHKQIAPDLGVDTERFWQVMDRSTGCPLKRSDWRISTVPRDAADCDDDWPADDPRREVVTVTIDSPERFHLYSVNFMAKQMWDSTQMYNYLTNGWEDDPQRKKEIPYDIRYPATRQFAREQLTRWLEDNPQVDVVRFTTFFYHFHLVFGADGKEKFVDWFGYGASVSPKAIDAFEAEYGYRLDPEVFVDEGYYNSPFRPPRKKFVDWMDFTSRFVAEQAKQLVDIVHAHGRTAMMFLGDNWIGTEPYGDYFAGIGLDAVVGSVGNAATCRMISDIPHVSIHEGRLLPYFFPDTFHPGGQPEKEAWSSWRQARRAIVRCPLDRIGWGGYLKLADEAPGFTEVMQSIAGQFRAIHDISQEDRPATCGVKVGVLNAWGARRSWQTHMVAHALPYEHTTAHVGVVEALAGMAVDVEFVSFADIADGVPDDIDVLINVGEAATAFSGGAAWRQPGLAQAVRDFIARGGGIIGVGEPAACPGNGRFFELADVFGVDRECGWSLSTDRYFSLQPHFITGGGIPGHGTIPAFDPQGRPGQVTVVRDSVKVHAAHGQSIDIATNCFGDGRAVYFAGLGYSADNERLLYRAIMWAAGREDSYGELPVAQCPQVDTAYYRKANKLLVFNNGGTPVTTRLSSLVAGEITLDAGESRWFDID
ncbi:1,3-beta-galactosyl-N-acetylhexosamine phosphorylase [Corynebacterium mendelii]|uniref:1,3-beta-galactosyl-N-acetylhexosamine phosphorylase n=1 Tax=Corynebacterium mendelii TaxID=2765362 RepID=A0A939IZ12_9CORY|nr:1,3-beta-galactosyl-N-acetylhexosamine phosphorylase [Corynebacterium mendelii]MBN9645232.1 1,3-beta-galactosyl-N-acetylhexosamine phosphorylase [Corynebacterium mendelii]